MGVTKAADTREELAHTYDATWERTRIDGVAKKFNLRVFIRE